MLYMCFLFLSEKDVVHFLNDRDLSGGVTVCDKASSVLCSAYFKLGLISVIAALGLSALKQGSTA